MNYFCPSASTFTNNYNIYTFRQFFTILVTYSEMPTFRVLILQHSDDGVPDIIIRNH